MKRIALLATVFAITSSLAGCLDAGQDADNQDLEGQDLDESTVESNITILPLAGNWTYGPLIPLATTCHAPGIAEGENGPFKLDAVTTTAFRVTPNDGTAPFSCSYSNAQFNCPNRALITHDLRPAIDAKFTVKVSAIGVMSDSRHAKGKQDALVTCVGTQCSLFGPMPCGFVDTFDVHTP